MPPSDPNLPGVTALFAVESVRDLLNQPRDRGPGAPTGAVETVEIRYLDYQPGCRLSVLYRATVAGERHDLVVTLDQSGVTPNPAWPLGTTGAWMAWYPHDIALAPLAWEPARLSALLGCPLGDRLDRLAWVPGRRATLADASTVVKLYADPVEALAASATLVIASGSDLRTAGLVASQPEQGLVAQQRLVGRPLGRSDALAATGAAAGLLHDLDRLGGPDLASLPVLDPAAYVGVLAAPVRLMSFVRPDLADRLRRASERLTQCLPNNEQRVVCHGDFNIGQCLATPHGLAVVDLDTLCLASRALDIASYAANLISGRPGDLADAVAVRTSLTEYYSGPLEHLDWYLAAVVLRRIDRPFRRLKRRWMERTDELLANAEALLTI